MKKYTTLLLVIICGTILTSAQEPPPIFLNLKNHIYTLADDSMKGRMAGSEGGIKASEYIADEFEKMDVRPLLDVSYFQDFEFSRYNIMSRNVIGIIDGRDPILKDEYIIVGAHFDHIGFDKNGKDTKIYNGADDNASGVAAMLEVARIVSQNPTARSVIFIAFDAEEQGLLGSRHFLESDVVPTQSIKLMFSVDMVGGLKLGKGLEYCGTAFLKDSEAILNVPNPDNITLKITPKSTNPFVGTDSDSFLAEGIAALYVNTGLETPYHQPEDDADLIDYAGLVQVTRHLASVVLKAAGDAPVENSPSLAKLNKNKKLIFGATIGMGSNSLHYNTGPEKGKNDFAFNIGLVADIKLYKSWGLQPEVKYERRYARQAGGPFYTDAVSVPMNVKLTIGDYNAGFFLQGGAYYNYIFDGRTDGESMTFSDNGFRNHEFGYTLGFGIHMLNKTLRFVTSRALTNTTSSSIAGVPDRRNHTFMVSYGFTF